MKKKAVLALTLAGLVALQMPMTALAADVTEKVDYSYYDSHRTTDGDGDDNKLTIDGNITVGDANGIWSGSSSEVMNVKVEGNVTNNSDTASTIVLKSASTVEVKGNVTNSKEGAGYAVAGTTVVGANLTVGGTVTGEKGVVSSGGTVTVGSVSSKNGYGAKANGADAVIHVTEGIQTGNNKAIEASNGGTVTAGSATNSSDQATVDANASTVEVSGPVTNNGVGKAIYAKGGATVTAGSVMSKGDGVYAEGENTKVTVKWNLVADGTGVRVSDGATATVGDVTVSNTTSEEGGIDTNGGTIVAGNVVVNSTDYNVKGIFLDTPDKDVDITVKNITVDKDNLTSGENNSNSGISAGNDDGARVSITAKDVYVGGKDGNIVGICASVDEGGTSEITVDNVTSTGKGIEVDAVDGSMKIVVNGVIKSNTYSVYDEMKEGSTGTYKIITSGLDKGTGEYFNNEDVANHVYYFVNATGGEIAGVTTASGDVETVSDKYAIKENDATIIKVKEVDGYTFKSMSTSNSAAVLTANGDGTYTLTMPRGGNVSLELVYEAIQQAQAVAETEEKKATVTGTEGSAVTGGSWNAGPGGTWTYRNNGIFKDTWGYITLANGKTGWFYFDKNGVMATGWKQINGKWYYFNEVNDGTQGMMLTNTTTPDGNKVGADGVWIQ